MPHPIVALQMNPLSQMKVETDTTFALGLEAQNRGYRLFTYTPEALSYKEGKIVAKGSWVTFQDQGEDFYTLKGEEILNLEEASFVLMRQNPPFDMAYMTATYLLESLPSTTRVINSPKGVRNAPEKWLVTHFPDLMPPTLLSTDLNLIHEFIKTYDGAIVKPLFDFKGNGVLLVTPEEPNLREILKTHQKLYGAPPLFQKFLKQVEQGDKRILLMDGKPVGIFKRIPPKDQIQSNMSLGGYPEACEFSSKDLEICARIGPTLRERGLYFAGIDIIGDYLIEINVTSPTGIRTIDYLYGRNSAKEFWEGLI